MTMKEDLADFDALPDAAKADYYRAKAKREADTSPEAVEQLEKERRRILALIERKP